MQLFTDDRQNTGMLTTHVSKATQVIEAVDTGLSVIREQLHREPSDDEIYIVMFKDGRIVCLFAHGNRSQKVYMDTDKLQQLIFQKRELLARETFSCRAFNRCEGVSAEMKCCYVEYLIERLEHAELDNRAMKFKETVRKKGCFRFG